ncbi:MAG: glycosyltransferase [Lysobacterales bacterium]
MRVLHIGKYYPPVAGGIETFCGDLFEGFAATDVECRMLVHRKPGVALPNHANLIGVRAFGEAFFTPLAPTFGFHMWHQIRHYSPDILHLHLPNPALFQLLAMPNARRIPWVIQWHSDVVVSQHQWRLRVAYPFYQRFERAMLKRAAKVVVASAAYGKASQPLQSVASDKLAVVPLGINPARLKDTQAFRWPTSGFRLAAVGRLTYYKGFDRLIRALVNLPDVSLVLLGDGQEHGALTTLIQSLNLQNRVQLITDAPDSLRNAVIAKAQCLCLPSIERTEAFGIVLVEALTLGTPVLATEIQGSGVPWVVNEGGHGLLAKPDDVDDLTAKLSQMMTDESLRQSLREGAANNIDRFHIRHTVAELSDLYRTLR